MMLTKEEAFAILNYLIENDYESVEDWARDSDYTEVEDGWKDEHGNYVDINGCLLAAIEVSGG